jgi:hypothetical protein
MASRSETERALKDIQDFLGKVAKNPSVRAIDEGALARKAADYERSLGALIQVVHGNWEKRIK